ncbi:MAG TPA: FadR/GntR family transcriptional regulator [Noviherbaspirillum sp.]|uniref:FadR/GntR family transcriptional regulator n=1 Tax=Noviherbaspirillum sp. TaxID=1926288 RepID=UPI002B4A289C|nr:FadR/GntR family transcriptional regulator [Noviherbaspirillum sp.]HJV87463.1 FadR/GntR family transcriptional regulator [Noviherbaspirillum sp.]
MPNTPAFQVEPLTANATMPDRVTHALLELIRSGAYPAKSRLPSETEMAQRFGVSRTVIREAVSRLKSEGLVESRQGSGVFVREVGPDTPFRIDPTVVDSIQSVLQVAELRRGLEAEIAALAAERATPEQVADIRARLKAIDTAVAVGGDGVAPDMEFHRSIARATANPHFLALWDFLGQFLKGTISISRAWEARQEATRSQVREEHKAIYDAIAARDPEAARAAARQHMEMASQRISTADPEFLEEQRRK